MSRIRIAVTGMRGQVVSSLLERAAAHRVEVIAVGRPELDLGDPASVRTALVRIAPDAIINAGAYTAVDRAEQEEDLATAINGGGAASVAETAENLCVPLVHISTDYVFDGKIDRGYREEDAVAPLGAYGRSKLVGELAVAERSTNYAILRTAWVYSPFGRNFLKTMLRLAMSRNQVSVVADQRGNPTSAFDIADGAIHVTKNLLQKADRPYLRGVFHMTSSDDTTWAGFARAIFESSARLGGPLADVKEISTADYVTPARRPANSRLNCSKLLEVHGVGLPDWRSSVDECVARVLAETQELA